MGQCRRHPRYSGQYRCDGKNNSARAARVRKNFRIVESPAVPTSRDRYSKPLRTHPRRAELRGDQAVSSYLSKSDDPFTHVHLCVHCGNAARREEFADQAHTTGIYPCPKCGVEGPLNIEIQATVRLAKGPGKTD